MQVKGQGKRGWRTTDWLRRFSSAVYETAAPSDSGRSGVMMSCEAYSAAMALAFAGALSVAYLAAPAPETAMALLAEAEPSFEKGQFSEEFRADLTPAAPASSLTRDAWEKLKAR
jgi:hypothetical protein